MSTEKRIKGGEKNEKSGQKWTREELLKVLNLYTKDSQLKIHESNERIQILARELRRTTRSVEAQLLMFRNLDRHGDYSFRNMNKLCKIIWKERYFNKKEKGI